MENQLLQQLKYTEDQGTISYHGVRYLLVRPETIMEIYRLLEKSLGERAGHLFYQAGYLGGKLSAKKYKEAFALGDQQTIQFMMGMGTQIGWGRFELVAFDADKKILEVVVHGSAFAQAYGRSYSFVCHLIRGVLAGLGEPIFGPPLEAKERSCQAAGAASCQFRIIGSGLMGKK